MKPNKRLCLAALLLSSSSSLAQIAEFDAVTDEMLQNPPTGEWLSWRGRQNSWGYSPLDQINTDNVKQLQLVWSWAIDDTGSGQAAPLVHNGVMFIPVPGGVVQALDAANGDLIWEYRPGITPSIDGTDRA
ncbi:MAG: hypothetical protein CMQ17_13035, partial [Gammaproteobacteria bacterium]|nr:hypothetical protein [Gammaproteobacteria bacterium]